MAHEPRWGYDHFPDDARWLLAWGLKTRHAPPGRLLEPAEWAVLVGTARSFHLGGLLIDAAERGALETDLVQRAELAALELELTKARVRYEELVERPLEALDEAGIAFCILKGTALAALDYPDVQQRPTSDVDVLVQTDEIVEAVNVLTAAGGVCDATEPSPGYHELVGKGLTVTFVESTDESMDVDLHRLLVWGPLGARVPNPELWQHLRTFLLAGRARAALGKEETLLHLAAHQFVRGVVRPREVRDVAQLLTAPDLDVEQLLVLARRWGLEGLLALAVLMADRELALTGDAHGLGSWSRGITITRRDRLWLLVEQPTGALPALRSLGMFIELDDRKARAALVRATVWPASGTWPSPLQRLAALRHRRKDR